MNVKDYKSFPTPQSSLFIYATNLISYISLANILILREVSEGSEGIHSMRTAKFNIGFQSLIMIQIIVKGKDL